MSAAQRAARTLLVIDPCRDTRALVMEQAGAKRLSVITATDPTVARTTLEMMVPDIVMTDMFAVDRSGVHSGIQLIRHIRERYPLCSIILMAEKGHESVVLEALRAGAVDFLLKPITGMDMGESLDRAIHAIPKTVDDVPGLQQLEYRLIIGTDLACVESTVSWLLHATARLLPESQRLHVRATLIELMLNAVEHGSLEICYRDKRDALDTDRYDGLVADRRHDPRFSNRKVTASASYDKHARAIRYTVLDEGKGFPWRRLLNRSEEDGCRNGDANGRGLFLARALFPNLSYNEAGTEASFIVPVL
ncbi:MAG TPA: response regulator [Nitrospiraceae bacterium]|nr:response regulator [Nitrospiraceae bacterium]